MHENGEEPLLPGLTDYNQRQLFWIRNAHRFCSYYSNDVMQFLHQNDSHTPHKYRILGSMMLSDEFARDFNCSSNTFMNPKKQCQIGSLWPDSPLKGLAAGRKSEAGNQASTLKIKRFSEILLIVLANFVLSYFPL